MSAETTSTIAKVLKPTILILIAIVAISSRLFSIIRFESVIHEFDPWFNYRTTQHLVKNGFYEFWNWFDEKSWYPLGRVVGGTVYPGIMVTSALIHNILHFFNFPVDIRNICVFLAPMFSGLTAFSAYLLTKELKDSSAGLLAAAFLGVAPGYISRSVAGSYDNEGIAIFLLVFTFYLWIKAVKTGSAFFGLLTALFYFYMVSAWGGYVFITNLVPLHAFTLVLMGRFSNRLYVSYSTFYAVGTLLSMQIPFVGFQPTRTSEHMAALGVFGLLQLRGFAELIRGLVTPKQFRTLLKTGIAIVTVVSLTILTLLSMSGVVAPFTGRFYSLWDTGYAKVHIPIIASVSEHQPTAWTSFFFDLQMLIFLFPAGVYLCFKELKDEHVFIILYSVFASYFAGVMVRLMLTLTPVVCVSAAIAYSTLLDTYLEKSEHVLATTLQGGASTSAASASAIESTSASKKHGTKSTNKDTSETKPHSAAASSRNNNASEKPKRFPIFSWDSRMMVILQLTWFLFMFAWHCTYVTSGSYSSPSIVLATRGHDGSQVIIDDFREAYYWLRKNTGENTKVMSWWDYGYQMAGMANITTLVDNNTWNNTHIATVGKAMATSEDVAYKVLRQHDVDYVLVIFGGVLGYSGDDINKFLWMIRIGEGVYPNEVKEQSFFTPRGEYKVDHEATPAMKNSLMYKMSYYRFSELHGGNAVDHVRSARMPAEGPTLSVLEEAYTTEHWLVRIYKVKDLDNIGRDLKDATAFDNGKARKSSLKRK
ncbi:Oligosaccharyl transferase STT3 subunit-domain-containing protein [Lobosporangium transversale]|uniref:Dolichyl-diphosphooligosaccharide--protein glycosyltransferase subunit STT3 n=1 Tax=Lobosporangium transversale TaxID=64571 RepID=A0A1Y2GNF8_9FUNG|nr:Oligosaccharyl transferase STT3 subunit-domain-containing protein [Lobosporangium transversale]ORZ16166.1 Oligosaccharyl transferase STT3 subunit-domain-containing protein [Lobosporangium transversale]|eukprot:XP_021881513.1 Oligosaccharyl transferase STT3 subunit-domain-containing protein [Lobosporangium transversale]